MAPRPSAPDVSAEQLAAMREELARLRYLCVRLIPELQPAALMRGETPHQRLGYLLSTVSLTDAMQGYRELADRRRPA